MATHRNATAHKEEPAPHYPRIADRKRYPKPFDFAPVPCFDDGHRWAGKKRCQAWNPNQGRQCMLSRSKGRNFCYKHGGKNPRGIAAPAFVHGRHSPYLPTRLLPRYQEFINDPEILSLRDEIGVLDARESELFGQVDSGESGRTWSEARKEYDRAMAALIAKDNEEANRAMRELGSLVKAGQRQYMVWNEIFGIIDLRRKLVESETKRRVAMQAMLTLEDAMALFDRLSKAIVKHVDDRKVLSKIESEFDTAFRR